MFSVHAGGFRQSETVFSFEAYQEQGPIRPSEIVLDAAGPFVAEIERAWGEQIRLLVTRTNLPHVLRAGSPDRIMFNLHGSGREPLIFNGHPCRPSEMILVPAAAEVLFRDPGGLARWSLSFSQGDFAAASEALLGEPYGHDRGRLLAVPLHPDRLRRLHAAFDTILRMDGAIPPVLSDAALADAIAALPARPTDRRPHDIARARRRSVVDGLIAIADREEGEALPLAAICTELAVPARTLNACVAAVLGMSAIRYLRRRRLHRVRLALREGLASSVTEAAMRYGFWELGRFAGEYRHIFGESPSQTLRSSRAALAGAMGRDGPARGQPFDRSIPFAQAHPRGAVRPNGRPQVHHVTG